MNRPLVPCPCAPVADQLRALLTSDVARNDDVRPVLFDAKRQCARCDCAELPMLVAVAIEVTEPSYSAALRYADSFQRQAAGNGLTAEATLTFARLRFNALSERAGRPVATMSYQLRNRYIAAALVASEALDALAPSTENHQLIAA